MSKEQQPIDKETYDLISANFRRDFPGDIKMNEWSIYKNGAISVLNQKKEPERCDIHGTPKNECGQCHKSTVGNLEKQLEDAAIHLKEKCEVNKLLREKKEPILRDYMHKRIVYLKNLEANAIKQLDGKKVGTPERQVHWNFINEVSACRRELEDILRFVWAESIPSSLPDGDVNNKK